MSNFDFNCSLSHEYLLRDCSEPDTILDPRYTVEKKKGKILALMKLIVYSDKRTDKEQTN